jgi:hypothetical protein
VSLAKLRRYGEKPSYPIYVWNGLLERKHRANIGPAIWEFLWCIDRITKEEDGKGFVLRRAPVNSKEIARDFGVNEKTVRSHFDRLEEKKYIERKLTPRGYSIVVLNSDKFGGFKRIRGREEKPDHNVPEVDGNYPTPGTKIPDQTNKNPRSNKRKQVSNQGKEGDCALWPVIGVSPNDVDPGFRELCEALYASKGAQSTGEFMGICMDAWSSYGNRIPWQFAKAAKAIRERERAEIPDLEAPAWSTK